MVIHIIAFRYSPFSKSETHGTIFFHHGKEYESEHLHERLYITKYTDSSESPASFISKSAPYF